MGNIFHSDFRDFIQALNNNNVKYLLVGGYAVIFMGIHVLPAIWIFGLTVL